LYLYYKLTDEYLEEITKEWSTDLLLPANPVELFDVDSPEVVQDTLGPSKTKNLEEVHDVEITSVRTASSSLDEGGDGEEIEGE
jgi:hypothetical protein